ncbi:MAG TPA: ATP-binding protein [Terriglobia bacterium]|nr:ATP-binding protein [Terriglobia bacterium]
MNPLNVLIIEDSAPDAELSIRQLRKNGFEVSADVVDTREAAVKRLRSKPYDVVLTDYHLPGWTGIELVDLVKTEGLEVPVILVTGAVGDETAADCMRRGVADYVLKNRLVRLPQAVRMALQEKALRADRQRAEEALKASEARYRRLFETAQNGIVLLNAATGKVIDVNPAALAMLENTPDLVLGKRLWELDAFSRAGVPPKPFHELREAEVSLLTESGKRMEVEIIAVTCHIGDKPVVQCSLRDITLRRQAEREAKGLADLLEERIAKRTQELSSVNEELAIEVEERKEAQEALAKLQHETELILDSAGEAIFRIGTDRRCTFANPAATRLTGYSREELLGQNLHVLSRHRLADGRPCLWEACPINLALTLGSGQMRENQILRRKDGTPVWVDIVAAPMNQDAGITGVVTMVRDVSERRAIEKLKAGFVAMVSHELRTPLTAIRGALGLIGTAKKSRLVPRDQRMVEIAISNTDRLVRLVSDILDSERLQDQPALERRFAIASELMLQAADLMRPLADNAGVNVEVVPVPLALRVDVDEIMEAFTNLLSNAIKFSPAGSQVRFECRQDGCSAEFRVIDQGPGIPPDKLESIFERFQPVDASDSRRRGGTGLGLSICRRIAERHGGRIHAESELGQGSTFVFRLPLEQTSPSWGEGANGAGAQESMSRELRVES